METIVVGAGQAGLATGYYLCRAGIPFTILEAGDSFGGSWSRYYNNLRLFSPVRYASLPGLAFPGDPDHYPHRDEVIDYLQTYARHWSLPITTGVCVERVECKDGRFRIYSTDGAAWQSRTLVAATGSFHRPYVPQWEGQAEYGGQIMHSSEYRNADPFAGKRVVVVGGGNSAVQIAVELASVARVTIATRSKMRWVPQRILKRDVHWWLALFPFERLPLGYWLPLREHQSVLDAGAYRMAIAADQPDQRPVFNRFTAEGVQWADGTNEAIDAVILATGYRPHLDYLAGLDALGPDGAALHRAGVSRTVPGLFYVGLPAQRSIASATLRGVGSDAAFIVRRIKRFLVSSR